MAARAAFDESEETAMGLKKRYAAILLTAVLAVSMSACGQQGIAHPDRAHPRRMRRQNRTRLIQARTAARLMHRQTVRQTARRALAGAIS